MCLSSYLMGATIVKYKHAAFWINCISNHRNLSAFSRELVLTMKEMVIWIFQYQPTEFFHSTGCFFLVFRWENNEKECSLALCWLCKLVLLQYLLMDVSKDYGMRHETSMRDASGRLSWSSYPENWKRQILGGLNIYTATWNTLLPLMSSITWQLFQYDWLKHVPCILTFPASKFI